MCVCVRACVCVCVELAAKYELVNLTQNEALPNYFSHPFFKHRKIAIHMTRRVSGSNGSLDREGVVSL